MPRDFVTLPPILIPIYYSIPFALAIFISYLIRWLTGSYMLELGVLTIIGIMTSFMFPKFLIFNCPLLVIYV